MSDLATQKTAAIDDRFAGMSPIEIRLAVALAYSASPRDACDSIGLEYELYANWPKDRKTQVKDAATQMVLDIAGSAEDLLTHMTLYAANVMMELMADPDPAIRERAARHILQHTLGKARQRQEKITAKNRKEKMYLVMDASPAIWDDDEEINGGHDED